MASVEVAGETFEGINNTALMLLEISGNLGNSQDIYNTKDKIDAYAIA